MNTAFEKAHTLFLFCGPFVKTAPERPNGGKILLDAHIGGERRKP